MEGLLQHCHNYQHGAPREESLKHVFKPRETLDQPCHVTLMVDNGKAELKAHRQVLLETSPFFQKLLNSDMKESKAGVIRLEMFSESVMATALEFMYTGSVHISTLEMAKGLVASADYLFLSSLRSLAVGVALNLQTLNTTNCISSHHFAEIYQCEELLSQARKFILENFTTVAKTEEFLNMSNKEVEMWISSDEINVSTDEDVFKIILAWIDRDKGERKKYFFELFRQVRLAYVTRDYLSSDVVTNDLVKDNEGCLDLVNDAMNLIDSKNYHNFFVRPRKSLETAVIVVSVEEHILGYFPREDKLCRMGGNTRHNVLGNPCYKERLSPLVACRGKLYSTCQVLQQLLCFDPFSKTWATLPCMEGRNLRQLFVRNEDEMYALTSRQPDHVENGLLDIPLYITRYKPDSNSWEELSLLKFEMVCLSYREGMCIVAKGSFVYFIGGKDKRHILYWSEPVLKDVFRYDLTKEQGDRLANLRTERESASGATADGKIFVSGGMNRNDMWSSTCEVYDETTNEWQFIAGLYMPYHLLPKILSADDKLYVLASWHDSDSPGTIIQCYDPERDDWDQAAEIPIRVNVMVARKYHRPYCPVRVNACSMRIFKGLLSNAKVQKKASVSPDPPGKVETHVACRLKCLIL